MAPLLAGFLATPLAAPLLADEGIDAAGQVFLRFNFGDQARDAGPRVGLRLGALPEPEPSDAAAPDFTEDFTSAFDLWVDERGRGALSLGGVRMIGIGGHGPTVPDGHGAAYDAAAGLGHAAGGQAVPRQLEPAPLVTAAGPADRPDRWAFRAVQPALLAMGPRFRRLAASLLQRRHGATTHWRFHPVETVALTAAEPSRRGAIAGYAALLLAPHGQGARQAVGGTPLGPQTLHLKQTEQAAAAASRHAAGPVLGQWVFRNLTGATAG